MTIIQTSFGQMTIGLNIEGYNAFWGWTSVCGISSIRYSLHTYLHEGPEPARVFSFGQLSFG
jgi:hypothetical protein